MSPQPQDDDEFEAVLRSLPSHQLSDAARERHRAMLASLSADTPTRRRSIRRRTHRRAGIAAGIAFVLVGGAGVGTAAALGLLSPKPPADRRIAHCYTTDSLTSPDNREDVTVATGSAGNPSLRDAASSAVDICRGGWQQGRYSEGGTKILLDPQPPPWNYPVPPLVACVLKSGEVGVFPGDSTTCQNLGLPVAKL